MNTENRYRDMFRGMFEEARQTKVYLMEIPFSDFTEEICRLMEEKNISRAELANRIGESEEYIKCLLGGNPDNVTLAGMVDIAMALDSKVSIRLEPQGE